MLSEILLEFKGLVIMAVFIGIGVMAGLIDYFFQLVFYKNVILLNIVGAIVVVMLVVFMYVFHIDLLAILGIGTAIAISGIAVTFIHKNKLNKKINSEILEQKTSAK
jgi:hypothetical protein